MGGYGSTRWASHCKRMTANDCAVLDATRWISSGMRATCACWVGKTAGPYVHAGVRAGSFGYEVDTTDWREPWIRLH